MTAAAGIPRIFVGLVSFLRQEDYQDILSPEVEGAVAWHAGKADSKDQFVAFVTSEIEELGFKVIEIEDIQELAEIEDARELDEQLAENMDQWEAGRMTVWGTLHTYIAEGEA